MTAVQYDFNADLNPLSHRLIDVFTGKAKIEKMSHDLKVQYELLGSATRMV